MGVVGVAGNGAQHIQTHDVARPLPDGVDGGFAEQASHGAGLHIAVAAEDFHGFAGVAHGTLAVPELGGRRDDAAPGLIQRVFGAKACGQIHGQPGGGFGFQCHIGQQAGHHRLLGQRQAEGMAVARVVQGLHQGLAHETCTGQRTVQAGVGGHFDDGGNAPAFLAYEHAPGVVELHFAAAVGAVAHLVLEALDVNGVLAAVGSPAWHEKAGGTALLGLGQHQMPVAHGGREEPFVAGDQVFLAPGAAAARRVQGHGTSGVAAHIAAALALRHAHSHGDGALALGGNVACVVVGGFQQRPQRRVELGVDAHQRNAGLGHGRRTGRAGLDLAVHEQRCAIGGPGRLSLVGEGQVGDAVAPCNRHHLVPCGVKAHLVDTVA